MPREDKVALDRVSRQAGHKEKFIYYIQISVVLIDPQERVRALNLALLLDQLSPPRPATCALPPFVAYPHMFGTLNLEPLSDLEDEMDEFLIIQMPAHPLQTLPRPLRRQVNAHFSSTIKMLWKSM